MQTAKQPSSVFFSRIEAGEICYSRTVQFDFNADGKSGILTGCEGTGVSTVDLSAAPSCSATTIRITVSGVVVDIPFSYQIIPIPSRLSAGAIAGITIGVLAVCAIAGFFGYRYYRQKQQHAQVAAQLAGSELLTDRATGVQYEPVSGAYVQMPATV